MDLLLYFVLPVALLVLGLPVYIVLIITGIAGILASPGLPLQSLQSVIFGALNHFPLLAIPLFVLAGDIMGQGGLARRLIDWSVAVVGGVRGSLGIAAVGSSAIYGAMSGSAVGCIAAIGRILYPALRDGGYGVRFSGSLVAATGAIDVVIPPSIPIIIYGIAAQQSVPDLFIAGFVPGLLIAALAALYVHLYARVTRVPMTAGMRWRNVVAATREAAWALGAPVVVLGGIYGGVFTPTEAAGIAVVYAVFVARYIYREVTWLDLWRITSSSMLLITQILIIVAGAGLYSWLVTTSGLAQKMVTFVQELQLRPWQLLLMFNLILLVVGSFLEPPAAILIMTPLFLPVMQTAGIDPIHLGMIMTVNLAIGMFTPPFGLNLFAVNAMCGVPLPTLYRGVLPFLGLYLFALLLITYIPAISLYAVKLLR